MFKYLLNLFRLSKQKKAPPVRPSNVIKLHQATWLTTRQKAQLMGMDSGNDTPIDAEAWKRRYKGPTPPNHTEDRPSSDVGLNWPTIDTSSNSALNILDSSSGYQYDPGPPSYDPPDTSTNSSPDYGGGSGDGGGASGSWD